MADPGILEVQGPAWCILGSPPRPPAGRGDEVLLVSILAAKWVGRERSHGCWRRMWITSWGPGGAEPRQRQGGSRCQARGQGGARPHPPRPVVRPTCCHAGPGAQPPRPHLSSCPGLGKGCAVGRTVAGPGPPERPGASLGPQPRVPTPSLVGAPATSAVFQGSGAARAGLGLALTGAAPKPNGPVQNKLVWVCFCL